MMRVLLLSQFYAPVVGGEERMVEDIAHALARRGHEVEVATLATESHVGDGEVDGVRVHRLRSSAQRVPGLYRERQRPHALPAPDPQVVIGLRRLVARRRPDVVHAHDWLVHSYLPLRRLGRPPVVLSLHDYSLVCATKRLFRQGGPCAGPSPLRCIACTGSLHGTMRGPGLLALSRIGSSGLRRTIDLFLPVSEAVADACGLRRAAAPFRVVPNFVAERPEGGASASELDALPDGGFVLFVGDGTIDKGIDVLLRAHSELRDRAPLVVIGRPYSERLRSAGDDVHVLGAQPHRVVLEAMRRSAVVVVPSLVPETFGMVALEAMASGRPLVASRVGALPELVTDGVSGVLVPPADAAALRTSLVSLLADGRARDRLGRAARAASARFSETAVVPELERAYDAVRVAPTPTSG